MAELREERRGYRRRTCRRRRRRLRVWSWRSLWRACRQRRGSWEDQTPGASDSPTNSTVSETWRRLNWREGKGLVLVLVLRFDWSLKENSRKEKPMKETERERLESDTDETPRESQLPHLATRSTRMSQTGSARLYFFSSTVFFFLSN